MSQLGSGVRPLGLESRPLALKSRLLTDLLQPRMSLSNIKNKGKSISSHCIQQSKTKKR